VLAMGYVRSGPSACLWRIPNLRKRGHRRPSAPMTPSGSYARYPVGWKIAGPISAHREGLVLVSFCTRAVFFLLL